MLTDPHSPFTDRLMRYKIVESDWLELRKKDFFLISLLGNKVVFAKY